MEIKSREPLNWLFIMLLYGFLGIILVMFIGDMTLMQEPSADNCQKLALTYGSLNMKDCILYMNDNPGSTGLEMLDYYDIKIRSDRLLYEPLD